VTSTRHQSGMTLVEVLLALLLFGVGALAIAGLQVTGLRASQTARAVQQLNAIATTELDAWRGTRITFTEAHTGSCATRAAGCTVRILPCTTSIDELACSSRPAGPITAYAVTVRAEVEGRDLEIQSVMLP
jgi:prepilin-type N-terminal cleavage/methylation domain-containing protein